MDQVYNSKSTGGPGERAYGVGDIDILGGPRLDELAADEEANPRLRGSGMAGEPYAKGNREQSRARRRIGMGTWGSGGNSDRHVRTGEEAASESQPAAAVESGAAIGDRRRPEAARGGGQSRVIRDLRPRAREWGRGSTGREDYLSGRGRRGASGLIGRSWRRRGGWILDWGSGVAASGLLFVAGVSCSVGIVAGWTPAAETEDDEDDWMSPCLSDCGIWCGLTWLAAQLRVWLVD
jgi:hypothetical protein